MRNPLILTLSAACIAIPASAQVAPQPATEEAAARQPVDRAKVEQVVAKLADELEANFVFPEAGAAYAAMLRSKLAAGAYGSFDDAEAFAETVTQDLQAVHADGHLRLHVVPKAARRGPEGKGGGLPATLNGISRSGWLADGVAYVRFDVFPGTEATKAALRSFLDTHGGARTLIIDVRSHRGGGLDEMDLMFPQMFDKPTLLVAMDTRIAADENGGSWQDRQPSLRRVTAPEGILRREHHVTPAAQPSLGETKIYLLTSNRTASAAEHLALSLKRTGRATLIGETTRGAGHYGSVVPLDEEFSFAAFVPVGRTFDPDTGEGWEGSGVEPDVEVPADEALDEALRLAGLSLTGEAALASLK